MLVLLGETWGVNPDAELIRLDYLRGNRPPRGEVTIDRTAGRQPLTVELSARRFQRSRWRSPELPLELCAAAC